MEPSYCPRCGREAPEGSPSALCERCGERLAEQSYCPVCERFWCAPVGVLCPKHEIPLEQALPTDPDGPAPGTPIDWVTVARFDSAALVQVPRLRLESEGIPTFLDGERMGTVSIYNFATGGVKLQVPSEFASEARILLSQTWGPPKGGDDDLDDAYDDLAPEPGARRRAILRVVVLLIFIFPPVWILFESCLLHWLRR